MAKLLASLRSLGPVRLAAIGGVGAAVLGLLLFLVLRGGAPQMALLYGDLELRDSAQVVAQLERLRVPHEIRGNGAQILVPAEQVARLRLSLAREGLPAGGSIGYEIFDRGQGLTATQFEQNVTQVRAMEGELARTIRLIQGVRAARVHLVLPRREPFARDRQEAQASILLTMAGVQRLDQEQVQAVLNLVVAAVPGLKPQGVSIVDSRGSLLARGGQAVANGVGGLPPQEELRRATEVRLARAVEEMLERSLGPGRARAEATVEMDLDRLNETQERYDPDGQVVRSQQSVTGRSSSREAQQNVSVQNNLPNPGGGNTDGNANAAGSQEQRQEETTNYEISRTVRTLVREQPSVRRVSMAVLVDGASERGPDGQPVWRERSAEEMQRIATLVKSAVGFDERRGDHVEVVQMRFVDVDGSAEGAVDASVFDRVDLTRLAVLAIYTLATVLALLFVVRPLAQSLIARLPAPGGLTPQSAGALPAPESGTGRPAGLPAPDPVGSESVEEPEVEMLSIANIEGQIRASSVRRVSDLVKDNPQEALAVLRSWMDEETARA